MASQFNLHWDVEKFHQLLTTEKVDEICDQFHDRAWQRSRQVMWTGIPRQLAQVWADKHEMQTLTTAMGPLMHNGSPREAPRNLQKGISRYMKGASAMFAYHIAQDEGVIVLSPPPPERSNPYGGTNYQAIEEPILKGQLGHKAVARIEIVHPTVPGAEEFRYQIWPVDETDSWVCGIREPRFKASLAPCDGKASIVMKQVNQIHEHPTVSIFSGKGLLRCAPPCPDDCRFQM